MALRSTASIMKGASQPPVEEEERQEAEDAPLLATDGGAGSSAAEAAERRNRSQLVTAYMDEFHGKLSRVQHAPDAGRARWRARRGRGKGDSTKSSGEQSCCSRPLGTARLLGAAQLEPSSRRTLRCLW